MVLQFPEKRKNEIVNNFKAIDKMRPGPEDLAHLKKLADDARIKEKRKNEQA